MASSAAIDTFPQGRDQQKHALRLRRLHFDESSFILNAPLTGRALNGIVGASVGWDA
jgi:hypothetical protein